VKLRIDALDKKRGMDLDEVEAACARARVVGCVRLLKVDAGMRGQLRAIEFAEDRVDTAEGQS
jgi:hypothetical protein